MIADQDDAPRALLALVEHAESRSLGAVVRERARRASIPRRATPCCWRSRARTSDCPPRDWPAFSRFPAGRCRSGLPAPGFPPPQRLLIVGPAHRRRPPARGSASQRRPDRRRARFPVGQRVSQHLPALSRMRRPARSGLAAARRTSFRTMFHEVARGAATTPSTTSADPTRTPANRR